MYFVPTYEIKHRYVQKGLNPDIFRVTGVPTDKRFNIKIKYIFKMENTMYFLWAVVEVYLTLMKILLDG